MFIPTDTGCFQQKIEDLLCTVCLIKMLRIRDASAWGIFIIPKSTMTKAIRTPWMKRKGCKPQSMGTSVVKCCLLHMQGILKS